MEKIRLFSIVVTAAAAYPLYQGFGDMPLVLLALVMFGITAVLLPSAFNPVTVSVWALLMAFFGFFAIFQAWRILVPVLQWVDSMLLQFFSFFE